MMLATCIEMGFLGLSFSATIRNATHSPAKHAVLVALPPLLLMVVGDLGGCVARALKEQEGLFVALIAFAVVALLFLVTQELLAEAFENTAGGKFPLANVCLFLGLFASVMVAKLLG